MAKQTRKNGLFVLYVAVSLAAIVVLGVLAAKKKSCSENYRTGHAGGYSGPCTTGDCSAGNPAGNFRRCMCNGSGTSEDTSCIHVAAVEAASHKGLISVNQDFAAIQRANGGPKWSKGSPGTLTYGDSASINHCG